MKERRSYEAELLAQAEKLLEDFVRGAPTDQVETRFQLLEAVASRLGGFPLCELYARLKIQPILDTSILLNHAKTLVEAIEQVGIHPALALSALARERLDPSNRRVTGAYHTDFRLAQRLAELVSPKPTLRSKVIDPACGAGILLTALSIRVCGPDRRKMARWLAKSVYACDRSPNALRGALLSLAALTSDVDAIVHMREKWRVGDSLLFSATEWDSLGQFDVVVGNPPWEKTKLSRHEFLKSNGHTRHYGAYTESLDSSYWREQLKTARYAELLTQRYPLLANGEPDLYVAFCELFERICKPGGTIAALVPAGLIRSQGTEALRRHLFSIVSGLSISIIENRARFFPIDTRFKFLAISCTKRAGARADHSIVLRHERGASANLEQYAAVKIARRTLMRIRPDLSIPEVRTRAEWTLFCRFVRNGDPWTRPNTGWRPEFCREADMTKERSKFRTKQPRGALPLIEGRMVQQHRFGAKAYISGSGRRAIWRVIPFGGANIVPQFYIAHGDVPVGARGRINLWRGGFCDITGQTNERSVMATLVSPGVVCGNKVPTILFPDDPSEGRLLVWCAIMNSLPFDWIARRVITTTINYFHLLSLPLPRLKKDGLSWRRLADAARELQLLDRGGVSEKSLKQAAKLRAIIDAEVCVAYGLDLSSVKTMLADFPLLDRGQPALSGEAKSTITRDLILCTTAKRMRQECSHFAARADAAERLGAVAYFPSESAGELCHTETISKTEAAEGW